MSKLDPLMSSCCTCAGTMAGGSRSELGSSRGDDTVRRLGRYQIIGRLATGGMAEVYLALSGDVPGFRTLVVVKRILPHLASNAQFIRMFLDEARLAALQRTDSGGARALGRVAHPSPGGLKGRTDYMSPEPASAEAGDHRAGVFALGVVLWEALTGRRLFRRETELATMRAIVDDPIPHPAEIASIPPELDAIVMRALRKRKDARFASASEMAIALERFAFSNAGFSSLQVASYMKGLFAAEYLQWRKTATAALDLEVERPQSAPTTMSGLNTEPPTAGPTMALRPGVAWQDGRSETRSAASAGDRDAAAGQADRAARDRQAGDTAP